jgi:hypothetical protein
VLKIADKNGKINEPPTKNIIVDHSRTYRSSRTGGSTRLVSDFNLDLSSATVRNEMAYLTEAGFLRKLTLRRTGTTEGVTAISLAI